MNLFLTILNTIVIENTCHLSNSPIRMFRNYTFCVHMHNVHTGANLHHLERRGKFLNTIHMAKHLHPRSNCAHERGFSLIKKSYTKYSHSVLSRNTRTHMHNTQHFLQLHMCVSRGSDEPVHPRIHAVSPRWPHKEAPRP